MTASTCNKFATYNKIEQYFAPARTHRFLHKAKRCLFGPVDHDFNDKWINEQLTQTLITNSIKYNIDLSDGQLNELRVLNPLRPVKRRCPSYDVNENSEYYFEPIEPDRDLSTTANRHNNNINNNNCKKSAMKQSLLTDFMQSKKFVDVPSSIKATNNGEQRPIKKPKLTDCSS